MEKVIFKARPSSCSKIMSGVIGLSDSQKEMLKDYEIREPEMYAPLTDNQRLDLGKLEEEVNNGGTLAGAKLKKYNDLLPRKSSKARPLTPLQKDALVALRYELANPQLPQSVKTYCKQWLKEFLYKRYKEIKSKYIKKGNATEEDGFTLMCIVLKLGMVKGHTQRFDNGYSTGICDLNLEKLDMIIDNKSSWDLSTFPMFDEENPDKEYEHQGQAYMEGYNRPKFKLVYTLVDCPIDIIGKEIQWELDPDKKQEIALQLVYTKEYWDEVKDKFFPSAKEIDFIEIPKEDRVKEFNFERDTSHAIELERRVKMCQEYIDGLLKARECEKVVKVSESKMTDSEAQELWDKGGTSWLVGGTKN